MKLRTRIPAILIIATMCLAFAFTAHATVVMKWTVDGVQREAVVYAPSKNSASGKAPVILAFHGHGDDMTNAAGGMVFQKVWPEAVVVYMQGLPTNPSADPFGFGWIYQPGQAGGERDLKLVDAVLATLHEKFPVDDRRIYAAGFSNGGMFTYVLWGTRASTFAAFAAVAGRIVPAVHLAEPKPILHIGGKDDMTVPFADQLRAIKIARELDGSIGEGTSCGPNCTLYPSTTGAPVETYIHGGGHVYPPDATATIVKFFKAQSLAP